LSNAISSLSYINKFFKIYFWEIVSFFFRFLSLAIVIPFLSKRPSIYGIYAICISLTIFLNYADLGFLKAIRKYATECYSRKENQKELKFHGFGAFILTINLTLIFFGFIYISLNPDIIIKDINGEEVIIAKKLLLIQSISVFVLIPKKISECIFRIRLDNHLYKIIFMLSSILTISSTFYFFRDGEYNIVGYFIFYKVIELVFVIICLIVINYKYEISTIRIFKYIKFDNKIYKISSNLSYNSLYTLITWVLFYELDQLIIGRYYGSTSVASYSIGMTIPIIIRSVVGIMYTPINEKTNLLIGEGNQEKLKKLFKNILILYSPFTLILCIGAILSAHMVIPMWVGHEYAYSIYISMILSGMFLFSFVTYPIDILFLATEQVKKLYLYSTLLPFILWGGFILFNSYTGFITIALFKMIAILFVQILYIKFYLNFIEIDLLSFIRITILSNKYSITFTIISLLILDYSVSNIYLIDNLIIISIYLALIGILSLLIAYYTNNKLKKSIDIITKQLIG
jgi:O-antigen/teichoic acid export membrane protein